MTLTELLFCLTKFRKIKSFVPKENLSGQLFRIQVRVRNASGDEYFDWWKLEGNSNKAKAILFINRLLERENNL